MVVRDVPGREAVADRIGFAFCVTGYDFPDIPHVRVRTFLDQGESADDKAGKGFEPSAPGQVEQHPVYMVIEFVQVFDEKDFAGRVYVRGRASEAVQDGQVPSDERGCGGAGTIDRLAPEPVGQAFSEQGCVEGSDGSRCILAGCIGVGLRHAGMNACYMQVLLQV